MPSSSPYLAKALPPWIRISNHFRRVTYWASQQNRLAPCEDFGLTLWKRKLCQVDHTTLYDVMTLGVTILELFKMQCDQSSFPYKADLLLRNCEMTVLVDVTHSNGLLASEDEAISSMASIHIAVELCQHLLVFSHVLRGQTGKQFVQWLIFAADSDIACMANKGQSLCRASRLYPQDLGRIEVHKRHIGGTTVLIARQKNVVREICSRCDVFRCRDGQIQKDHYYLEVRGALQVDDART